MNINFHYCAVKATAILSGFGERDAELIATYSQMVDDYKVDQALNLTNVPSYCSPLVKDGKFHTVRTGFNYVSTVLHSVQENVIMPFHFIPPKEYDKVKENYRTCKAQHNDRSLIDDICNYAITYYKTARNRRALIFLGAAFHVFADTYAHACFNGFNSNDNKGNVKAAISSAGERRSYGSYSYLPPIGHAKFGTAPDESDLNFTFRLDGYKQTVPRINWYYFADCAVEICKYFQEALGLEPSTALEARVQDCVAKGCQVKGTEMESLATRWKSASPYLANIPFHYTNPLSQMLSFNQDSLPEGFTQKETIMMLNTLPEEMDALDSKQQSMLERLSQVQATATPEFYEYNFAAYTIRKAALHGKIA